MTELFRCSAEELARRVRSGSLSAREVVAAHLRRTEAVEPRIHAYLWLDPEGALRRADELDRRLAAGEDPGPLAGVPVAIKDNLALADAPMTCASRILEGYTAPNHAAAVERLLDAGAVVLGKTNLDELGMGSSCEYSAYGPTHNPWALERSPGGSSGGSAAAVAAGSVPLALGSDTGGSVRQPAAWCGLVGLKPTYGRVSRWGLVAFASSLDQVGPLGRCVRDVALALEVMAGPDDRDARSETPSSTTGSAGEDFLRGLEDGIDGRRFGVIRELPLSQGTAGQGSASTPGEPLDPQGEKIWRHNLAQLEALGAEVVDVSVPAVNAALAIYHVLANSEASSNLARFDGVRYGGRRPESREAGGGQGESLEELYLRSRSEGLGREVQRRILLGTFALSAGYREAYYERAQRVAALLRQQMEAALEMVDFLVSPTTATAPFPLGSRTDEPLAMYLADRFTCPASLAGLPAVAVPAGSDDAGLPRSLHLVGRRFGEAELLSAARAFETQVGWEVRPALADAA
ncbi:MAG: Asp-tRNA(Asn)/Glu-tRNA(Gln) amidotransferase subunit GatA [Acidobacteriota bacterium]|nr:Asp-tRNA(Asn)/Glu-tRNA(Gln) amidotransferase subunit GatA [Acidobacteriota bacterium]